MWGEHKEKILKLKSEGKSEIEISRILGCNRSTVQYHCSKNGKINRQKTNKKFKISTNYIQKYILSQHPFLIKIYHFEYRKKNSKKRKFLSGIKQQIRDKLHHFFRRGIKVMVNKIKLSEVISKIGENPKCYLTGDPIDIKNPSSYNFDHIIPVSRGGTNSLDNLGVCTRDANFAKRDMTHDEFINLCKKVVENLGYNLVKKDANKDIKVDNI